jgi:hypothetical protein
LTAVNSPNHIFYRGVYNMTKTEPQFEARPADFGSDGWCVHVTWPSGKKEVVTGFANQYGALNWIQREAANWVAEKIMTDPKIS